MTLGWRGPVFLNASDSNVGFTAASQVSKRGDAQTRPEAEGPGGRQRGDGGIQANHGRQAEETHSDQEGEGPGVEGTEGKGKHPQASGRLAGGGRMEDGGGRRTRFKSSYVVGEQLCECWDVIDFPAALHDDAVFEFFCHVQQKACLIWNK